jgi:uncharacterized protein (TIGR02270 family)
MPPLLKDILVEHSEELAFLWTQRCRGLFSPLHTPVSLAQLDARIEAHVEGLLVAEAQLVDLVGGGLEADDAETVFAAAYPLLRLERAEITQRILEAFLQAQGGRRDGLRQALSHGPVATILEPLRGAAKAPEPELALAALDVLAFRSPSDLRADLLERFLLHEEPDLRRRGWRLIARLKNPLIPARYKPAVKDKDPGVRVEALVTSAWARQSWLLDHCRMLVKSPKPAPETPDALRLLAVLGGPDDLGTLRDPRWANPLGASWFDTLGSSGYPGVVVDLVRGMENPNPRLAVAAGAAFTTITGCDVESKTRVSLPPEDGHEPSAFEKEFLDEAFLPDPARARDYWKKHKDRYTQSPRWYRGRPLTRDTLRELFKQLDLRSRHEACLRARFADQWAVGPTDLERFPQL